MNYYSRHLGDYARDTGHLSILEHGAYTLLLDRYYVSEAGIPADQAHRLARARTREEKQAVDMVLEEFFTLEEGIWINKRCEEEIAKAQTQIKANQENGRKGGRPRKKAPGSENETQEKPNGFSMGSENETEMKGHQTPIANIYNQPTNARAPDPDPPPGPEPAPDPAEGQPMHPGWQPSAQFHAVAKLAGLPKQHGSDFAEALAEFVSFWLTRPDDCRTQAQWEHALVKSLQARKTQASRPPTAKPIGRAAPASDRLPAWRIEELRRQFEATPDLVPAHLLPQIGIDPATRRPFARPAQGVTIIDTTAKELPHEPASRLG
ncbi:DUF1376 domain-containing protein [Brachymonas wangyanguii]|uniref:DUF1376 domain-containing protein n=1 Tax=Brachymonas wangyanguii TaxID=3130163 RepID=UPI00307CC99A